MEILVACSGCWKTVRVPESFVGRMATCKACGFRGPLQRVVNQDLIESTPVVQPAAIDPPFPTLDDGPPVQTEPRSTFVAHKPWPKVPEDYPKDEGMGPPALPGPKAKRITPKRIGIAVGAVVGLGLAWSFLVNVVWRVDFPVSSVCYLMDVRRQATPVANSPEVYESVTPDFEIFMNGDSDVDERLNSLADSGVLNAFPRTEMLQVVSIKDNLRQIRSVKSDIDKTWWVDVRYLRKKPGPVFVSQAQANDKNFGVGSVCYAYGPDGMQALSYASVGIYLRLMDLQKESETSEDAKKRYKEKLAELNSNGYLKFMSPRTRYRVADESDEGMRRLLPLPRGSSEPDGWVILPLLHHKPPGD